MNASPFVEHFDKFLVTYQRCMCASIAHLLARDSYQVLSATKIEVGLFQTLPRDQVDLVRTDIILGSA
jgi:hypothetical protein